MSTSTNRVTGWVGWIWFAGIVMITLGLFNAIDGLIAIFSRTTWIGLGAQSVYVLDVSAWGWIHLILGAALAVVGFFLFTGKSWARWLAVALVVLNAVAQFVTMPITPWWSLTAIVLDVFVLWALVVHGDEAEDATA